MKNTDSKFLILFCIGTSLFIFCIFHKSPIQKTLQINYTCDSVERYMFLNVREIKPNHYIVDQQEWYDTACPIIITEIFNYETF